MNQAVVTGEAKKAKLKVLSLDGGGIKGVFPSAFLSEIEKSLKSPLYRYFDLVVGTSTGGIIALGLGLGLSAARILEFYMQHGPKIFAHPNGWMRRVFRSKYSSATLQDALREVFGDAKLGDSKVRLMIPSFNANNGEIHLYKTRHHERFLTDYKVSMVDVALATAAAPTYFPAHKGAGGALYLDGGLWANNSVGNAAVEAVTWLKSSPANVDILSIGCTQFPASFVGSNGLRGWALGFAEAALRAQSGGSLGIAYSLLGHGNVKRVNPMAPPGKFGLDNAKGIEELATFGYLEARKESSDLCSRFMAAEVPAFSPLPF